MAEVIVIGAGPVGLLLAAELSRRGVAVEILEQRPDAGHGSRAIGLHAPVLAALQESGLTEELLEHALKVRRGEARSGRRVLGTVRFDQLSTRFPFVATLPQAMTEQVLSRAAPAPQRGTAVTSLRGDPERPNTGQVEVTTSSGVPGTDMRRTEVRRAPLVVLAGGARSRGLVYQDPEAHSYPDRYLMSDVEVSDHPDAETAVVHLDGSGVLESFPLPGSQRRFVAWDRPGASTDPDHRNVRMERALLARGETPAGQATAFGVRRFVAPAMRNGRLFVVGDAAHEVSPIGGQGMNLGLLDAATLAPLLAAWMRTGTPPEQELQQWEKARVGSARRAAELAALNTRLGRPASGALDTMRRGGLRLALGPGARRLFAHAYAMGFDAHSAG